MGTVDMFTRDCIKIQPTNQHFYGIYPGVIDLFPSCIPNGSMKYYVRWCKKKLLKNSDSVPRSCFESLRPQGHLERLFTHCSIKLQSAAFGTSTNNECFCSDVGLRTLEATVRWLFTLVENQFSLFLCRVIIPEVWGDVLEFSFIFR